MRTILWILLCSTILILIPEAVVSASASPGSVLLGHHRTEPDVAVDPIDPRIIAVATNPTYRYNSLHQEPVGIFISHDGGLNWTAHDAPMVAPFVTGSDPSVAFAPDGTLFVAFEAVSAGFCGSASRTAVLVTRSTDAGASFRPPAIVDINPANDKPFMTAGPGPGGLGESVFVSWIRFASASSSQIAFSRSLDGGRSFSTPILLSAGYGIHVAPMPATDNAGHVYVAWLAAPALPGTRSEPMRQHMEIRASSDGGVHFGATGSTPYFRGLPGLEQPGSMRLFNGPSLAVANSHRLYLSWAEVHPTPGGTEGTVQADVVLSRSIDGGQHWSGPFTLNDSARGDRFEPQIAVGPGGWLVAVFYDRRRNGSDLDLDLVVVRDRGTRMQIGPNLRLTAQPAPISVMPSIPPGSPCLAQGRFFGDYIGISTGDGQANMAWTSSSSAYPRETMVRFQHTALSTIWNSAPPARTARW